MPAEHEGHCTPWSARRTSAEGLGRIGNRRGWRWLCSCGFKGPRRTTIAMAKLDGQDHALTPDETNGSTGLQRRIT